VVVKTWVAGVQESVPARERVRKEKEEVHRKKY